jgi:hypothetical protein
VDGNICCLTREINLLSTQLVDVIPLMWQHVSTSKCHLQAGGIKYVKGILPICNVV